MRSPAPKDLARFATLALLVVAVAAPAAAEGRKVPGNRFSKGVYTAPGGEFTLRCDDWLLAGARAEEQQVAASTRSVTFVDGSGGMYGVVRTVDAPESLTVDVIASGFTVDKLLRDKRIVATSRGRELRLLGVNPEGSTTEIRAGHGREPMERNSDLYGAWSIFVDQGRIFRVTASVTRLGGETDSIMFARATRKLESMLAGLTIPPRAP